MSNPQQPWEHSRHSTQGSAPTPPRTRKKWPFVVGAVVLVLLIAGLVNSLGGSPSAQTGTSAQPTRQAPQPPAEQQVPAAVVPQAPAGPATQAGDGTYQVGTDIAAGQYKTPGPDKTAVIPSCYWSRLKDDSGEFSAIIANNVVQGPGSVTVKKGEYLELSGGCTWTKV